MRRIDTEPIWIEADTKDPRLLYHAGMICYLSGHHEAARHFLQRALADPFRLSDNELHELHTALARTAYLDS